MGVQMDRSEALEALREIAVEVLDVAPDQVVEDARFREDLEADSLDLIEILMAVEDRLGITLPQDDPQKISTVGDGIDLVIKTAAVM